MTQNTLGDLNNHLFEQLERLNDESLSLEELEKEIKRTDAMTDVATQIIGNANTILKAKVAYEDNIAAKAEMPKMLEG